MSRSLITKREITEQDLLDLVGLPETDWIDFKAIAYGKDKKIELCKDVISFANAEGGLIILGMTEEQGVAKDLRGLGENFNVDLETRHLSQVIEHNIHPIIPGFRPLKVQLCDGKEWAIVLQIPRSPAAPHAIRVAGESPKFHIRRASKTSEMTYEELRMAFLRSGTLEDRVRAFRSQRLEHLYNRSSPEIPGSRVLLVIHSIPLWFSEMTGSEISISGLRADFTRSLSLSSFGYRLFNLDGVLFCSENSFPLSSYLQLFRHGTVEFVRGTAYKDAGKAIIDLTYTEEMSIKFTSDVLLNQIHWSVPPPLVVGLTLVNTEDSESLQTQSWSFDRIEYPLLPRRPRNLIFPELVIEEYPSTDFDALKQSLARQMRPAFDILWNTYGLPESPNFDKEGNWSPQKR